MYTEKEAQSNGQADKKKRLTISYYEWCDEILSALVIVVLVFSFILRIVTVRGPSMEPTLIENDRLVIESVDRNYKQGDIIVIVNVLRDPIVKRVIATEYQEVNIDYDSGVVYVDGAAIDESIFGISNNITKYIYSSLDQLKFPQKVPTGCVFVLGDNRPVSEDSRYSDVGMVDTRNILGRAVLRLFPTDRFGALI